MDVRELYKKARERPRRRVEVNLAESGDLNEAIRGVDDCLRSVVDELACHALDVGRSGCALLLNGSVLRREARMEKSGCRHGAGAQWPLPAATRARARCGSARYGIG